MAAEPSTMTESEGRATFTVPKGRKPFQRQPEPTEKTAKPAVIEQTEAADAAETEQSQERQAKRPTLGVKTPRWVPKEEWQGDPDDWVSKKEFDKRQELYDSIYSFKSKTKETDSIIAELREHNRKMAEALRKATLGDKLKLRDAAIAEGDREKVYGIEREMQEVNSAIPHIEAPVKQTPQAPPELQKWVSDNAWFNQDPELHYAAIGIHQRQLDNKQDYRPLEEKLDEVTAEIRKRFPEKFGGRPEEQEDEPKPKRRSTVESPATERRGGKKTFRFSDLTEFQQQVCKKFVRKGVMSEQQYIDDLVSIGELK